MHTFMQLCSSQLSPLTSYYKSVVLKSRLPLTLETIKQDKQGYEKT